MNSLFFSIKRIHLRVVRWAGRLVRRYGLTAARFDLLRIVEMHGPDGVAQTKLCALLGVSAATVSRMLKSLEELGIVVRGRPYRDRRFLVVRLTSEGVRRVTRAIKLGVSSSVANRRGARAVTGDPFELGREITVFETVLMRIRRFFRDPAPGRHPWMTEDLSSIPQALDNQPRTYGYYPYPWSPGYPTRVDPRSRRSLGRKPATGPRSVAVRVGNLEVHGAVVAH